LGAYQSTSITQNHSPGGPVNLVPPGWTNLKEPCFQTASEPQKLHFNSKSLYYLNSVQNNIFRPFPETEVKINM